MTAPTAYTLGYTDGRNAERVDAVAHLHRLANFQPDPSDARDLLLLAAASLNGGDHIGQVTE